jgi:hypothetical protein
VPPAGTGEDGAEDMATAITLTPGRAALADWRAVDDGAAVGWAGFDPKWSSAVET